MADDAKYVVGWPDDVYGIFPDRIVPLTMVEAEREQEELLADKLKSTPPPIIYELVAVDQIPEVQND